MKNVIDGKVSGAGTAKYCGVDNYLRRCDFQRPGGDAGITTLMALNSRILVEEHLDADDYEAIFCPFGDGAEPVTLCVQIPADLDARMRQAAADARQSLTAYIVQALMASL